MFPGLVPTSGKMKADTYQHDKSGSYVNADTPDEKVAAESKPHAELREGELIRLRLKSSSQHSDMNRHGYIFFNTCMRVPADISDTPLLFLFLSLFLYRIGFVDIFIGDSCKTCQFS